MQNRLSTPLSPRYVPALVRPYAVSTKLAGSNSITLGSPASPSEPAGVKLTPSGLTSARVSPAWAPEVMRMPSVNGSTAPPVVASAPEAASALCEARDGSQVYCHTG